MTTFYYLFGKFNDQDIDWLVGAGSRNNVPAGQILIHTGQPVKWFYITLSGRFRVMSGDKLIGSIAPGEAIGELSFLGAQPPSVTVVAAEDCVVVSFSAKRLRTKLRFDQGFASRFYHALAIMLAVRLRRSGRLMAMLLSTTQGGSSEPMPSLLSTTQGDSNEPIPSPLSDELSLLSMLGQLGARVNLPANATLMGPEQPTDQFYVTISGWFLVTVQQQLVAYIGPNEAVGELCMLDGLPPDATVTASEDCVVLSVAVSELREQLRVDRLAAGRFYLALGVLLASRVRQSTKILSRGNFKDHTVSMREQIPPMLLDDTTLAGARFDEFRRDMLES